MTTSIEAVKQEITEMKRLAMFAKPLETVLAYVDANQGDILDEIENGASIHDVADDAIVLARS